MKDLDYTKKQFLIISCLVEEGMTNSFKSYTYARLAKETESNINTVRNAMKIFLQLGYVAEGMPSGKAQTFYVTGEGTKKYKEYFGDERVINN